MKRKARTDGQSCAGSNASCQIGFVLSNIGRIWNSQNRQEIKPAQGGHKKAIDARYEKRSAMWRAEVSVPVACECCGLSSVSRHRLSRCALLAQRAIRTSDKALSNRPKIDTCPTVSSPVNCSATSSRLKSPARACNWSTRMTAASNAASFCCRSACRRSISVSRTGATPTNHKDFKERPTSQANQTLVTARKAQHPKKTQPTA
ncbi:hypothetical protein B0G81_4039 [Paraburkholderia sp. BL6665CI2N2]|nr:hypothetical protein B0G81_4039 [Paraburkholderia sp. BL6665CI2N2]